MVLTLALYTAAVVVAAGVVLYVVGAYNQVVAFGREADRAFANIEVSLKQRHDEIPALVETCKGYMTHEKETLQSVTALRSQVDKAGDVDSQVVAENALTGALSHLFALAENYPELKANDLFLNLHKRLTEIEDTIADRRENFNASVTAFNTLIESFPALMLARVFAWRSRSTLSFGLG